MGDDKKDAKLASPLYIDIHENYEIRYWSQALGCTADELKTAVHAVGTSVAAVRDWMGKNWGR